MTRTVALAVALLLPSLLLAQEPEDPYLWLEDVLGERSVAWVEERNARALAELEARPEYAAVYERSLAIYDSQDRIPDPELRGEHVDNFWQDSEHERGILRRTTLESYRTASPEWETLLDLDALSAAEGETWVYGGSRCLGPEYRRCLVTLSRGGSDAAEERELDAVTGAFVEGGFFLPEAKSGVAWKDEDTLWVATDFGEGTLTDAGYARIVKEWRRGTPLAAARPILEIGPEDNGLWPASIETPEGRYPLVFRARTFFSGDTYLGIGERLVRLDIPEDAAFQTIFRDHAVFSLRSDWQIGETTYRQGSLLAGDLDDLLAGRRVFDVLFEPAERVFLDTVAATRDALLVTTLDNVTSRLYRMAFADGAWGREEIALPGLGTAAIAAASDTADVFFFTYEDFLTPDSLFLARGAAAEKVKSMPAFFDATGLEVSQHEATSKDGTRIPYFLVAPQGLPADGTAPTLLYGYGGFEISQTPYYSAIVGAAWLERGGVYALANIRGGGEFGPAWHQAAVRENHHRNFEDFAAVAEDLVSRHVTSPRQLGIMGGSQGGLLVGGTFTQYPELFGAVVCQVPLLDMRRYHELLAGASWMSEYGDPDDPEDWAYIRTWSPYQLLRRDADYPSVFFWTTTRDDRVHPAHARKMVARMEEMGHPVLYFENIEGGHGSGAVNAQRAQIRALEYAFLWSRLSNVNESTEPEPISPAGVERAGESPARRALPETVWLGPDDELLPFSTPEEVLDFLLGASIESVEDIPIGVTRPKRLMLARAALRSKAVFRHVDVTEQRKRLSSGRFVMYFRDSYLNEVAAYELSRLLGLSTVPPAVVRSVKGQPGSVQIWVENATMETERRAKKMEPPDRLHFTRQFYDMRVFDNLINNIDRNSGNILLDPDWKMWWIDHTRAFARDFELPASQDVVGCSRSLFAALKSLDEDEVAQRLRPYLGVMEVPALLERRRRLIELIERRVAEKGEDQVLFDYGDPDHDVVMVHDDPSLPDPDGR